MRIVHRHKNVHRYNMESVVSGPAVVRMDMSLMLCRSLGPSNTTSCELLNPGEAANLIWFWGFAFPKTSAIAVSEMKYFWSSSLG